jgi:hypothetical protein
MDTLHEDLSKVLNSEMSKHEVPHWQFQAGEYPAIQKDRSSNSAKGARNVMLC